MPLERIDRERYFDFASLKMSLAGVSLDRRTFEFTLTLFDGITWYVQVLLNRLYERRLATEADVRSVVDELLVEKNWEYAALLKSLPDGSVRLLKAVAKSGKVRAATAGDFMSANGLRGASSVHQSLERLLEDEILYEMDDGCVVYDRLFALWLARLP